MSDYLQQLRATEEFQQLINSIKEQRPVIPVHNYAQDNTEAWKAESNRQIGFDLCLSYFGEEANE